MERWSPEPDFITMIGIWRAREGDYSFVVEIGTEPAGGRVQRICQVSIFEDRKPARAPPTMRPMCDTVRPPNWASR